MSNKTKGFILLIVNYIVAIIVPLVVTIVKFNLFTKFTKQTTGIKITIIGSIVILITFAILFKRIIKYLNKQDYSFFICMLKGLVKLIPLICILLVLVNIINWVNNLIFIVGWIVGCNIISLLIIEPIMEKCMYESKLDVQRKIISEGIHDA